MKITALFVMLIAAPAFAQSRVYTNADLGKKLPRTHAVTPEELDSLRAHQFVLPHEYHGPTVTIMPYDDSWSRTPLSPNQPLDPNWRPVPIYGGWSSYRAFRSPAGAPRHEADGGRQHPMAADRRPTTARGGQAR